MTPDAILERVRALALAMPESAERLSHGSPGFHIEKGKFFAYFWDNSHSDGASVMVKTTGVDEQAMLIESDPDFYYRPAYYGPSGWVSMRVGGDDPDWDRVAERIAISWELVAPRRLLEAGGR